MENINAMKLRQIQTETIIHNRDNPIHPAQAESGFSKILSEKLNENQKLQFSKHSKERIAQRGIQMTDAMIEQMNTAVDKAKMKGARDVVMIGRDAAFIVNIPNNIVITAIDGNEMKDNIFTNIDSAVLL